MASKPLCTNIKNQELLYNKMLVAYQQSSQEADIIDKLEQSFRDRQYSVQCRGKQWEDTLDTAILSLKGRLLAFSGIALLLLIFIFNNNYSQDSKSAADNILTQNTDNPEEIEPELSFNSNGLPGEQDNDH